MKHHRKKFISGFLPLLVVFASVVILQQCSGEKSASSDKAVSEALQENHEEIVRLTQEELKEFGIEISTAGPGKLEQHVDLTGEIVIDPTRLAHIVPRFPGIVMEVHKQTGDRVIKDEVLAIIESNESLAPYEVKSLIDGTVIEMHLTRGEMVTDETHAFVVADLRYVWANLNIYQKDLPYIKFGQTATISGIEKDLHYTGKISYISPVVDKETRTAIARVIIPNSKRQWRPGMFVTAKVIIELLKLPVMVPKTALQTFKNQTVVFIQTDKGFKPQPVKLGRSNTQFAEIVSGLPSGRRYVANGGFTLKAELQKETFGDKH